MEPCTPETPTPETPPTPAMATAVTGGVPHPSTPAARRPARQQRPVGRTTRPAPPWASEAETLPFAPSRWMARFVPQLAQLNAALQRLEAHTFTLLGMPERDYVRLLPALRTFREALHAYRQTTRQLTVQAHALAQGQVDQTEEDDAPAPAAGEGGMPEHEAGAEVPTLAEELAAWQVPALGADEPMARHGQEDGDATTALA